MRAKQTALLNKEMYFEFNEILNPTSIFENPVYASLKA